ncbi:coiled-coil domain-containing glutamate-rich protein 1-like [Acanthochromis polyacanthus]|uniref:Coiled-coil domain-containing glutamate-rich protein 1-like n=1 Tax=Acanthochromis polyacanthus TaxID=80966 RepID=A0A3Q1HS82_9TELE|nr:coiled-coil domain-containing glutamate-rich protein 1-like [Acanthochromis polyacanthus]
MPGRRFWLQELKERRKPGLSRSGGGRRATGRGGSRGHCAPNGPVLRPVNVKGNRARGMRAPKNTNQFLMHEKYQMMHLRSDSVGGDSCSSDSDPDLTDMDSYLGVLENARGALLDSPNPHGSSTPGPFLVLQEGLVLDQEGLVLDQEELVLDQVLQEDSLQYFPSEDDLLQSQNFMQKDFVDFCDVLTP